MTEVSTSLESFILIRKHGENWFELSVERFGSEESKEMTTHDTLTV